MLIHPTLDQLRALRLDGMAKAMEEQLQMSDIEDLRFEDRLALLLDRESTERASRRLRTRLRKAKLRQGYACVEDVDYRTRRGLDKGLFMSLTSCEWEKPFSPVPWRRKLAGKVTRCSTCACLDSSKN